MSGPTIRIREQREDERDAVRRLTLAAYAEHAEVMAPSAWAGLHEAVIRALDSDTPGLQRLVAEADGALVGAVQLYPPNSDAYQGAAAGAAGPELRLLAVSPAARGRGVGKALVDECVRRARAMGATELGLHSSDSLRAAIRMYRRMGFQRVPERDFQPEGAERVKAYRLVLEGREE